RPHRAIPSFPARRSSDLVGTAWIASALGGGASLTSVELEPRLAGAAGEVFASLANVEVVTGDWLEVMPRRAPFDLVFFDGGGQRSEEHTSELQSRENLVC